MVMPAPPVLLAPVVSKVPAVSRANVARLVYKDQPALTALMVLMVLRVLAVSGANVV